MKAARVSGESGLSLVLVLWLLALMFLIAPGFVYTMRIESAATSSFEDEASAWALAVAGVYMAATEVSADYEIVASNEAGLVFLEKTADGFLPLPSKRDFQLGEGTVSYRIEDERAKVNLNTAPMGVIDELLRLSGADKPARDAISDSIIDWRDENSDFHLNGAEDDYYGSLPFPYGSKDGPFDFIEELLLVKGVSREIFYGAGGESGIGRLVTVHGDGKLNLNTAGETVLSAVYGEGVANEILLKRKTEGPIIIRLHGGLVTSEFFLVTSTGEKGGIRYTIEAAIAKKPGGKDAVFISWREHGVGYR
ncbi:MAG: general secretion pathway protein GspK [Deltaproteobacteria bacterium]|nr:general secretion pathway protein GspK [Deltaproteobacteria bacterium]MBZ0219834.1 general secretion pathway protein GspK [Deltaproteobacteria bacterium]